MGFTDRIKSTPQTTQPSWMDAPIEEVKNRPIDEPKIAPANSPQNSEGQIWVYKGCKNENLQKHRMPYRLERLILSSYDIQNWFETCWMVLNLNNRWTLNEFYVPEHLIDKLGASKIGVEENTKTNEVIWSLKN